MAMLRGVTPLTPADRQSALWRRLKSEFTTELELLRTDLERTQSEATTASIRTRLQLLREILALERDPATTARRHYDAAPPSDE